MTPTELAFFSWKKSISIKLIRPLVILVAIICTCLSNEIFFLKKKDYQSFMHNYDACSVSSLFLCN